MSYRPLALFSFCCLLFAAGAKSQAAIVVTGGTYNVTAGALVSAQFTVSDSAAAAVSAIEGMTFTVQIGDGTNLLPKINTVDLLTGTVWSGLVSPGSIFTPTGGNQLQYQSRDLLTDVPGDFINANGLLATITIDTTGAMPGTYPLLLTGTKTLGRDSVFLDGLGEPVAATFNAGSLTIVAIPEPSFAVAGALCLLLWIGRRALAIPQWPCPPLEATACPARHRVTNPEEHC